MPWNPGFRWMVLCVALVAPVAAYGGEAEEDDEDDAPPPGSFVTVPEALPMDDLGAALKSKKTAIVAVAVTPPSREAWAEVAAQLHKDLRAAIKKHDNVDDVVGPKKNRKFKGRSDEEIVQVLANKGATHVVVGRLYPGDKDDGPPKVVFTVYSAAGKTLASLTSLSVVVVRGKGREGGMAVVSKVMKGTATEGNDNLKEFKKRAVRLRISITQWSNGRRDRDVTVTDGRGHDLGDSDLPALAEDEDLRSELTTVARYGTLQKILLWSSCGLCPAMVVGGATVGCVAGCAIGSVAALVFILANELTAVVYPFALAAAGVVVGGIAGFLLTIPASSILWAVRWVVGIAAPTIEDGRYAKLISDHNLKLAKELNLDPADLDDVYFPNGR